jgi:hypothetical protein
MIKYKGDNNKKNEGSISLILRSKLVSQISGKGNGGKTKNIYYLI